MACGVEKVRGVLLLFYKVFINLIIKPVDIIETFLSKPSQITSKTPKRLFKLA
jgi:hypothetical protein